MHEGWTCNKSADNRLGVWGRGEVLKSCGSVLPKRHIFVPVFPGLHQTKWEKDDLSTADPPLLSFFVAVRMPRLWVCSVWTAIHVLGACLCSASLSNYSVFTQIKRPNRGNNQS